MKSIFLVDADDTILDFHGASERALKHAFAQYNIAWKEEFLSQFRYINGGLWEALERRELTRTQLMERRFPIYLEHLGLLEIDGASFNQCFLQHLATHPAYLEGAEAFLTTLRTMGRVYIVTNGTAWIQKSRFDISKLWGYAEEVFVSDIIGFDKPAQEYTQYVINHIPNFSKEEAAWIGDSLSADIKAANEANITSIWFNRHQKEVTGGVSPVYIAKNFDEVLEILRKN